MSHSTRQENRESKKSRKRRLREALALVRGRIDRFCTTVAQVDGLVDRVTEAATDIRDFVNDTEFRALVPGRARRRLDGAVRRLNEAGERTDSLVDA